MLISDWSSDVCSSVLSRRLQQRPAVADVVGDVLHVHPRQHAAAPVAVEDDQVELFQLQFEQLADREGDQRQLADRRAVLLLRRSQDGRSEEHTSELQSLMRISYAVFCLKKKNK